MSSSINSSYNLLKSLPTEEIEGFISGEVLSGEALAERLTRWKEESKASSSKDENNHEHFLSLISELTQTSKELFSQNTEYRKYFHHLNHMEGCIWTYEELSDEGKKGFNEFIKNRKKEGREKFSKSKEEIKDAPSSKAEYWEPSKFLPLRIYSYVLEFLETKKNDFVSPHPLISKKKYSSFLAQQIASDIETLKYYNICQRIRNVEQEIQAKLYDLLKQRVKTALEKPVFPNGYLIASGCSGHCLYVSLKIQDSHLIGTIFERGLFSKYHEIDSSETVGIPCIYPYTFKVNKNEDLLGQVLKNLREAQKEKLAYSVTKKIYQIDIAEKVSVDKCDYTYTVQTADNCVLANHNITMLRIFGFQKLIDLLIRKEKTFAAERSLYDRPDILRNLQEDSLAKAEKNYSIAIESEKGPKEGAPNWEMAFENYKLAHELDLRKATAKLGFFYYYGLGTSPDLNLGIDLLKYSADEGDSFGQVV